MINASIAKALDMEIPEAEMKPTVPVEIEPHEIVALNNPELPDMTDAERRLLEGEKQLEQVIIRGMNVFNDSYDEAKTADPKNRARHYEIASSLLEHTLTAIIHKTDLQLRKKEARMKEADFYLKNRGGKQSPDGPTKTLNQNIFLGTHSDIIKMLRESSGEEADK